MKRSALLGKGMILLFLSFIFVAPSMAQITSYNANTIPIGGNACAAFGQNALNVNFGLSNTAVGINAMRFNQGGNSNVACGYNALTSNVGGSNNTAVGGSALSSNVSGDYNTAVGTRCLLNSTGTNNTAMGADAMRINTTGNQNTAVGREAMYNSANGSGNTAMGYQVLYSNSNGAENAVMGMRALYSNLGGSRNAAIGFQALYSNSSGSNNTANGHSALYRNTIGNWNTASGQEALYNNTSGSWNTAAGAQALYENTTGRWNVATGQGAMLNNDEGSDNTATGVSSLYNNLNGIYNTGCGRSSLYSNTIGTYNTGVGASTLNTNTTGSYNTGVGYGANVMSPYLFNATALGNGAIVDNSNKVRVGNANVNSIGGQVAWSNFSDGRIKRNVKANVPGLTFINLLQPVTYNFDLAKQYELMGIEREGEQGVQEIEQQRFTGFIAQDVEAAAKQLQYDFSGVDKSGVIMGLRYSEFVVPLVQAVQELSAENDAKEAALAALQRQVNALQQQLEVLAAGKAGDHPGIAAGDAPVLEQNIPNPASGTSRIPYSLPRQYESAYIALMDANGNLIQRMVLSGQGKGEVQVTTTGLASGTYGYCLIVDGKNVGTRKMVIAR